MNFDTNKLKTMPKRLPGTTLAICQSVCGALALIILGIAWLIGFSFSASSMMIAFFIAQPLGIWLWNWWQKIASLDVNK